MNSQLDVVWSDCTSPGAWQAALAALGPAVRDVYFTPEYHRLHERNRDGNAAAAIVRSADHLLLVPGLLSPIPTAEVGALPACDLQTCNGYGGPLADPDADADFLAEAWDTWRDSSRARGVVAGFFRLHPLLQNAQWLPPDAAIREDRSTVAVDLSDSSEIILRKASAQFRNMISKSRRNGTTVAWNDKTAWTEFPSFYDASMRRLNAPATLRFSAGYFDALRQVTEVEIASIADSDGLVAASVFMFGPKWAHYHLSARTPRASNECHSALVFAAIERARERGLEALHLGGGRTPDPKDGLLAFKAAIGCRQQQFRVAAVVADPPRYRILCDRWEAANGRPCTWLLGYRQPSAPSALN